MQPGPTANHKINCTLLDKVHPASEVPQTPNHFPLFLRILQKQQNQVLACYNFLQAKGKRSVVCLPLWSHAFCKMSSNYLMTMYLDPATKEVFKYSEAMLV